MANLSALLEKEASAEIEAILSEARARASELVAKARTEADAGVAQQERSAKAQYDAALVRSSSGAQLEASSLKLRAQHGAVERVFAAAKTSLEALTQDKAAYGDVLNKLLTQAVEGLGGAAKVAAVVVNPADQTAAEKAAAAHGLAGKVETSDAVRGGVRVRATGGNVTLEKHPVRPVGGRARRTRLGRVAGAVRDASRRPKERAERSQTRARRLDRLSGRGLDPCRRDYGYINARVRGLKSKLLGPEFYASALEATDYRAFLAALSQSPYLREVEEAQARYDGLKVVDKALARDFYTTTRSILNFSDGLPHDLIALLLLRYDLYNVKAVARAKHAGRELEAVQEVFFPAGTLKPAVLDTVAGATDMAAAAQALLATPTPLKGAFSPRGERVPVGPGPVRARAGFGPRLLPDYLRHLGPGKRTARLRALHAPRSRRYQLAHRAQTAR